MPPDKLEENRAYFEASARLGRDAAEAGVTMVAGTDGGFLAPYILAGFCLHDELELMVRIGLTPMQAILAATRDAARTVGLHHVSGTVTPGKFADLLVVDGNPLTDIRNNRRIHAVVANGRFINRAERERMLAGSKPRPRRSRRRRLPCSWRPAARHSTGNRRIQRGMLGGVRAERPAIVELAAWFGVGDLLAAGPTEDGEAVLG